MSGLGKWLRARKGIASLVTIALLAGGTIAVAVTHQGFPVTDVDLNARDVWVTNGKQLLAGRMNRQIEELNGAVNTASNSVNVFQDGDKTFLHDMTAGTLERIDPSFTTLVQRIQVPVGAQLAFGNETMAVLERSSGKLWLIDAAVALSFDARESKPVLTLGKSAQLAVAVDGTVFATSPSKKKLYSIAAIGEDPTNSELGKIGEHQLSAVGDVPVVLDTEKNTLIVAGKAIALPRPGIALQQSGADSDTALVAAGDGLLSVPLDGGKIVETSADIAQPLTSRADVSAPVWLDGCAHSAWAGAQKYLAVCEGQKPALQSIDQPTQGSQLEFRVNRSVIALNNLSNGNVWLMDANMRLVENWSEVTPPDEEDAEDGDEKASKQSFEDTIAERTNVNRAPTARDDAFGVRPGKTTILPVLENDTDSDGDVLTISAYDPIPEAQGVIELIDGGRALQFTPSLAALGTVSFRYTASDGQPGGVAEAGVNVEVRPLELNEPPVSHREAKTAVEQGQIITYNVLSDWIDPDGDDLYLVSAAPTSDDSVRFGPEGFVTFEHRSAEIGLKEVQFIISDGTETSTGTLTVDVKPTGSLNPVGTPDYASGFVGQTILIEPLHNDLSPSGVALSLLGISSAPPNISAIPTLERGSIAFSASMPGSYVLLYSIGAGAASGVGLIRVDVQEQPEASAPPIAVKDVAYLRAGEPLSIPVLNNDVSPSGRVLAVQSVDTAGVDGLISVEMLTNAVVRVSSSEALTEQMQFTYTISDGEGSSTAGITVVPVPPLVKHQPPVAVDDSTVVRAGDIVTVAVLDNDYHPDSSTIRVMPDLVDTDDAGGFAFVSENTVRYQAPTEPGNYSVRYQIGDDFEESASATVRFIVVAPDVLANQAPTPSPVTTRTFADSTVKIEIPLDGIDPDGDSALLRGINSLPTLGRIIESTANTMSYEAYPGASGTDTFSYEVVDTFGEVGIGSISVGVIPRPAVASPPVAIDDIIEVKPGRTVSVPVWLNDSDPAGYKLSVAAKLPEVAPGLKASVKNDRVIVQAPEQEGSYSMRYQITNGQGGSAMAFVHVTVSNSAKAQYPTAVDQLVSLEEASTARVVSVQPLLGAQNPAGLVEELVLSFDAGGAESVTVQPDGTVDIPVTSQRQTIAYTLTNEQDKLSAKAFIVVPAKPEPLTEEQLAKEAEAKKNNAKADEPTPSPEPVQPDANAAPTAEPTPTPTPKPVFPPPHLVEMPQRVVKVNAESVFALNDLVVVPSGKPLLVLEASATNGTIAGQSSTGSSGLNSLSSTQTFRPTKDYRGPASVSFLVTDGTSADDPEGVSALLTIPVTVGDPNMTDASPTFTPVKYVIEAGAKPFTFDLRDSTGHPNPALIADVTYSALTGANADVTATLVGSKMTVAAPLGAQPGAGATLSFSVKYGTFTLPGTATITVASSTRPKAQAIEDNGGGVGIEARPAKAVTVPVLTNDFNPFAVEKLPLTVIGASLEQDVTGGAAKVSFTADSVTVTPGPGATGTLTAVYRIQDSTKDKSREVQGRVRLVIRDVPDAPKTPTASDGDASATVVFSAPASNNSPITKYTIRGGPKDITVSSAGTHEISGLTNGTSYSFTVTATNAIGDSMVSAKSNAVRPFGVPGAPNGASLSATSNGSGSMTMSWGSANDGGRAVASYNMRFIGASSSWSGSTTARSYSSIGGINTSYTFQVQACNARGCGAWTTSNAATPSQPPVEVRLSKGPPGPVGYYYAVDVSWFPSGTWTVSTYCGGGGVFRTETIVVGNNGNGYGSGSFRGSYTAGGGYCGYSSVYVGVTAYGYTYQSSPAQNWS